MDYIIPIAAGWYIVLFAWFDDGHHERLYKKAMLLIFVAALLYFAFRILDALGNIHF